MNESNATKSRLRTLICVAYCSMFEELKYGVENKKEMKWWEGRIASMKGIRYQMVDLIVMRLCKEEEVKSAAAKWNASHQTSPLGQNFIGTKTHTVTHYQNFVQSSYSPIDCTYWLRNMSEVRMVAIGTVRASDHPNARNISQKLTRP